MKCGWVVLHCQFDKLISCCLCRQKPFQTGQALPRHILTSKTILYCICLSQQGGWYRLVKTHHVCGLLILLSSPTLFIWGVWFYKVKITPLRTLQIADMPKHLGFGLCQFVWVCIAISLFIVFIGSSIICCNWTYQYRIFVDDSNSSVYK